MEVMLIIKAITLGADLLANGLKAYNENKDALTSEDQALIQAAIARVSAENQVKEQLALAALDAAAKA